MPKKKGKKGKGKGKKNGKTELQIDKESDIEKARANAALWEARLNVTEQSRSEYREAVRKLARDNEDLTNQHFRLEKDTMDMISFFKKKDAEKEEMIADLHEQIKEQKQEAIEENEKLIKEYSQHLNELEEKLKKRMQDFQMIQSELKMMNEFRKKKPELERELEDIRENMYVAKKEHRENLARTEHKFFSEKLRLEKETEQKIAQLAETAQNEAILQLDDTTRSVFKENVRLNEALRYHMKEAEDMKKMTVTLVEENKFLLQDKVTNDLLMQEKIAQVKRQKEEILELQKKVASLEQALDHMACEFETEKQLTVKQAVVTTETGRSEMEKLQKLLQMKDKEMNRVKLLAKNILDQRTQVEQFFLQALDQVRQEITASRAQYKQAAQDAYQRKMQMARNGQEEYPRIRTFTKNEQSTNSVYHDLEEADKWNNLQSNKVDISELTWEQKEKVLRLLFAKMNGLKTRKPSRSLTSSAPPDRIVKDGQQHKEEQCSSLTFITQASVAAIASPVSIFPDINPTHLVQAQGAMT
ncbi:BBOF1 factor, partial [Polypterus senegalus]|nr:basal body-orientation factor 1-like [Polypterus senegalus]MBN3292222.1 BBOF1 factor [Polypterus senegalus]